MGLGLTHLGNSFGAHSTIALHALSTVLGRNVFVGSPGQRERVPEKVERRFEQSPTLRLTVSRARIDEFPQRCALRRALDGVVSAEERAEVVIESNASSRGPFVQ